MANILYITPTMYTTRKHAGGMGTKTKALMNAWSNDHNIESDTELDPVLAELYDVIIIELLGFRNDEKFDERIETLKACPAPKLVYGSDSEILRWSGKDIKALAEVVSLWLPNMKWQANYFRDFDLPVTEVVYEPINCDLFRPNDKREPIIIAGGAISYEKQSEFFIELFNALKGKKGVYQTAYLGGNIWGGKPSALDMELRHEMKEATDIFYGEVKQEKVASALGSASIAVLHPHYETCNRFDMECMASGLSRVCGSHVCYDERPTAARFDGSIKDCIEQLGELTIGFSTLPDETHGEEIQEYAVEHWSYEASLDQLNSILRGIL